jgi:Glycosyl transferase family 2
VPAGISACIIAFNEETDLPDCIASVSFCEEIVVVDSGSSDSTVEIAQQAGARVIHQPWLGFAAQRNVALDHARCDWVLEIDADERVSASLRREIEAFIASPPDGIDLAGLPLREIFLGHRLGPSAKYPKYRHRLLRRGTHRHSEDRTVHEGLVPHGTVHSFDGELQHLLATSWREAIGDAWRYARLEAGQLPRSFKPAAFLKGALLRPPIKFVFRVVVDGGWRDGWPGFAKITIDCVGDSIVWTRHLLRRRGGEMGRSGVEATEHYGARKFREGNLRVLGLAAGTNATARASKWLDAARAGGADISLIADRTATGIRTRALSRIGVIGLIRALDAEEQLRTLDAVVAFDRRTRMLLRCTPPALRGHMPHITEETDPGTVNWRTRVEDDEHNT